MKKMLITGASGFLGSRLVAYYKEKYEILSPSHGDMDITDEESVERYFSVKRPDIVVHCAAISDTGLCEREKELSWKVNVTGSEHIAKCAKKYQVKCVMCSSDQVYCGSEKTGAHSEDEKIAPYNVYGKDKAYTEQSCLQINEESIHLRLAWMFDGREETGRNDFLKQIRDCVSEQREWKLPNNDKRGITDVWEVVKNMEAVFLLSGGIYNFGAPNTHSTYETAAEVFRELNYDTSLLCEFSYERARNLTMAQEKINACGIYFSSTEQALIKCLQKRNKTVEPA